MILSGFGQYVKKELNFFRIHLTVFIVTPLFFSGIFFASNGEFPVSYIDAVFLCYSAMTVTGLSTVNLSQLTGWQQATLFVLMVLGDQTVVSLVMVLIRKRYFRTQCQHLIRNSRKAVRKQEISPPIMIHPNEKALESFSENTEVPSDMAITSRMPQTAQPECNPGPSTPSNDPKVAPNHEDGILRDATSFTSSPRAVDIPLDKTMSNNTVRFEESRPAEILARRRLRTLTRRSTILADNFPSDECPDVEKILRNKDVGFGGFPSPFQLLPGFFRRLAPKAYTKLERSLTIPHTRTFGEGEGKLTAKWLKIKRDLIISRNSHFHTDTLSNDDLEAIGGVEYRALRTLSYVVGLYFILTQLIPFIVIASWLSRTTEFDSVFEGQIRLVPKAWFVAFNVLGAYTGGGMSLVDTGMVSFQKAYVMIIFLGFCILAGNHALPVFLRLTIWLMSKIQTDSRAAETLHFLLDHPRRCYVYMFPSEVTWFLVAVLVFLTSVELFTFCVLDIGLAVTDSLPPGTRIIDAIFQGLSVRASGFAIVSLSSLAPATQFLYVVMMYISVYPVAMSIRSTNVYEEHSLGIFEGPAGGDEEPNLWAPDTSRRDRIGKYLGWHIRRQLSFDLWWLVVAVWLVCIIERAKILDDDNISWFNTFRIVFELVSAYSTIGLTLGIPTQNYAFSGSWTPLSKIVLIVIMLRGRHRGLPVAVDRAILLPTEYKKSAQSESKVSQQGNGTLPV